MSTEHIDTGTRTTPASERSTAELAGDLVRQTATLVHHEMELAKVEMTEKTKQAGMGVGLLGFSGVVALFGFACLTAAAIAAIQLVTPVWLAALIVGGAYLVIAGITGLAGAITARSATPPVPEAAIESSKEDVQWLKQQAESARR